MPTKIQAPAVPNPSIEVNIFPMNPRRLANILKEVKQATSCIGQRFSRNDYAAIGINAQKPIPMKADIM